RARQGGRLRDLGRRAPGGAVLPHRRQPVPPRRQGRRRRLRRGPAEDRGTRRARVSDARDELARLIDSERDRLIAFLQGFARGDTRAGADYIRSFLDAEGVPYRVIAPHADKPNLLGSFAGAAPGRHLVLNGHIDVFPAGDRARWTHDPWSGEIVDGAVWGRG